MVHGAPKTLALRYPRAMPRSFARIALALVCVVLSLAARASAAPAIPEPLRPWIDWVAPAGYRCAMGASAAVCVWPGRLDLDVDEKGATFRLEARVDEGESLALPGSDDHWPLDVKVDNAPGVVLSTGGPHVLVGAGPHTITGRFAWTAIPASLAVPAEIGLLRSLRVKGATVASPNRDKEGVSLITASEQEAEPAAPPTTTAADHVDVRVVRLLTTDRPLQLDTWIRLKVSGKSRELLLGPALPEGFVAVALHSKWPARVEPDGRIRVRVTAGEEDVVVGARATGTPSEIKRPAITATWTSGDEVWAFVDRDLFQMNSVEGPPRVPKTALGSYPVQSVEEGNSFAMKDGASLRIVGRPRLAAAGKDSLKLERVFDIASDGSGVSVADTITGKFAGPARLEFTPPLIAGEAGIDSQRQVLGSVEGRPPGFEVPASSSFVYGNSWLPRVPWTLPVDAFGRTYDTRDVTIHAQAGWLPLYVSGAGGGLINEIALGDLLLVALIAAVMFLAYGSRVAALGGVTLVFGLLFPALPTMPFLAVAVFGWLATRASERRQRLALAVHRVLVVLAALWMLSATHKSLLLAFEPESVQIHVDEAEEDQTPEPSYADKSGGTGTKHKGAEGMMGDPSKTTANAPIAFDSDDGSKKADLEKKKEFELRARSFDPSSLPQFGPGAPSTRWISLGFRLPEGQTSVRAIWSPPVTTACLFLLRVLLSVALVIALLRFRPKGVAPSANPLPAPVAAAATALLAILIGSSAHAQVPDQAALDALKTHLSTPPACRPNCTQIARVALEARKKSLVLRMEVHAGEAVAFTLPTGLNIADVLVDRRPADLTRIEPNLIARLDAGIHEVTINGTLEGDAASIGFGTITPHLVQPLLDGWTLAGVREDGSAEAVLTLSSSTPGEAPQPTAPAKAPDAGKGALAVMISVRRQLDFDIEWKVRTTVARMPAVGPMVADEKAPPLPIATAEIALLPGESIVGGTLEPRDGKVTVTLDGHNEVTWTSTLEFRPELSLVAPAARDRFESWTITSSSRWRVTHAGLRQLPNDSALSFAPWPGEAVKLTLVRPTGLPGATARLERSDATCTDQGASLALQLEAAQMAALGWSLQVPDGYDIEPSSMQPDWVLEGRTLRVKTSHVSLKLRRPRRSADALLAVMPPITVAAKGLSATTHVRTDGWVVYASASRSTHGGRLSGNLVGLSLAIALAFVARVLGQDKRRAALAAFAGLMITSSKGLLALAALVVIFLLLEWRRRAAERRGPLVVKAPAEGDQASKNLTHPDYTVRQLALGVLCVAAILGFVAYAVTQALYGAPMGGRGEITHLTWFLDRHDGFLPGATLVTLPMFVYRLVMVGWLVAWAFLLREVLPRAWAAFSLGGALKPVTKVEVKEES